MVPTAWDHGRVTVREAIREALALLTRRDRRLFGVSILLQMATSLLDLAGVLLLGLVGALAVTTVQSQPAPAFIEELAQSLGLGALSPQALVAVLAGAAGLLLLSKSLISSMLTRRVFVFLANRQALVAARLSRELLRRPLTFIQMRSSQETAYALIQATGSATLVLLGHLVVVITEATLLVVLGVALLFLDPVVTLVSIAYFGLVALVLQRVMGNWASRLGATLTRADIASLNAVQEALGAYREVSVAHRREMYANRIQDLRWESSRVASDRLFIQQFPKYVFEAALVLGGLALACFLFLTEDSVAAVGTLALFLAAASRVMPSLLRLQGATLGMRDAAGAAEPAFELANDLGHPTYIQGKRESDQSIKAAIESGHAGFHGRLVLRDVSFQYPGTTEEAVREVSLEVEPGASVALVGRSGAGKSTLADLILGILEPTLGRAEVSGVPAAQALERWPGAVAYVPQETFLVNGTVRENVALGLPLGAVNDDRVWQALERSHIADFLREEREGLDTALGERGLRLSGGQRQRIGIARALYTEPLLLVLDEATSALDSETEEALTETLSELEGQVTTVVIAHRLSTVRHVDHMVYLEHGRVLGQGTFDQVRGSVPGFARQASLMGL